MNNSDPKEIFINALGLRKLCEDEKMIRAAAVASTPQQTNNIPPKTRKRLPRRTKPSNGFRHHIFHYTSPCKPMKRTKINHAMDGKRHVIDGKSPRRNVTSVVSNVVCANQVNKSNIMVTSPQMQTGNNSLLLLPAQSKTNQNIVLGQTIFNGPDGKKFVLIPSGNLRAAKTADSPVHTAVQSSLLPMPDATAKMTIKPAPEIVNPPGYIYVQQAPASQSNTFASMSVVNSVTNAVPGKKFIVNPTQSPAYQCLPAPAQGQTSAPSNIRQLLNMTKSVPNESQVPVTSINIGVWPQGSNQSVQLLKIQKPGGVPLATGVTPIFSYSSQSTSIEGAAINSAEQWGQGVAPSASSTQVSYHVTRDDATKWPQLETSNGTALLDVTPLADEAPSADSPPSNNQTPKYSLHSNTSPSTNARFKDASPSSTNAEAVDDPSHQDEEEQQHGTPPKGSRVISKSRVKMKSYGRFVGDPNRNVSNPETNCVVIQGKKRKRRGIMKNYDTSMQHRRYGGPPFTPCKAPPAPDTPSSATCCLFEHTLLKMATRGFWGCEMGKLQDVFRSIRSESIDLDTVEDVTKRCYGFVRRKLLDAEEDKKSMYHYMKNYIDEFDNFLERVYPVAIIAILVYLPTASDYSLVTWHGIPPTGWSEYRRAVVMREVFEVLYHFGEELSIVPEYEKEFFDSPVKSPLLVPRVFDLRQNFADPTTCVVKNVPQKEMKIMEENVDEPENSRVAQSGAVDACNIAEDSERMETSDIKSDLGKSDRQSLDWQKSDRQKSDGRMSDREKSFGGNLNGENLSCEISDREYQNENKSSDGQADKTISSNVTNFCEDVLKQEVVGCDKSDVGFGSEVTITTRSIGTDALINSDCTGCKQRIVSSNICKKHDVYKVEVNSDSSYGVLKESAAKSDASKFIGVSNKEDDMILSHDCSPRLTMSKCDEKHVVRLNQKSDDKDRRLSPTISHSVTNASDVSPVYDANSNTPKSPGQFFKSPIPSEAITTETESKADTSREEVPKKVAVISASFAESIAAACGNKKAWNKGKRKGTGPEGDQNSKGGSRINPTAATATTATSATTTALEEPQSQMDTAESRNNSDADSNEVAMNRRRTSRRIATAARFDHLLVGTDEFSLERDLRRAIKLSKRERSISKSNNANEEQELPNQGPELDEKKTNEISGKVERMPLKRPLSHVYDKDDDGGDDSTCVIRKLKTMNRSVAFEALWTQMAVEEPNVLLDDENYSLGEYLEKFPIETHCPPDRTIIKSYNNRYYARDILGYVRRGTQLVEQIADEVVVDTTRTVKKNSVILAVRKVPPGKISKLVHPDLHLENYTSYLLPVGVNQPIKAKKGGGKSSKPKRKSSCSKEEGALKSEPQSPSLIGSPFNSVENEQYRFTPPPKKLSKLESDEEYVEHCEKKEIGLQTDERCNTVSKETQTEQGKDLNDNLMETMSGIETIEKTLNTAMETALANLINPDFVKGNSSYDHFRTLIDSYERAGNFLLNTAKITNQLYAEKLNNNN